MPDPNPNITWHCKPYGAYARTSSEAYQNGICVFNLLSSLGWTPQAAAAFWGNVEAESGYNPWRWESDQVPSSNEFPDYGYGLVQFTPSGKYIENSAAQANDGFGPNYTDWAGCIFDGDSQCRYIDEYADYFINPLYDYPITYDEFKHGEYSVEYLAKAWLHNYERPGDQSEEVEMYRAAVASFWYAYFTGVEPTDPIPPHGGTIRPIFPAGEKASHYANRFTISMYLKPNYKRL